METPTTLKECTMKKFLIWTTAVSATIGGYLLWNKKSSSPRTAE